MRFRLHEKVLCGGHVVIKSSIPWTLRASCRRHSEGHLTKNSLILLKSTELFPVSKLALFMLIGSRMTWIQIEFDVAIMTGQRWQRCAFSEIWFNMRTQNFSEIVPASAGTTPICREAYQPCWRARCFNLVASDRTKANTTPARMLAECQFSSSYNLL